MRKMFILTIASLSINIISNSQIIKGSTYLGGNLSFGSSTSKSEDLSNHKSESSSWSISPQFGKALKENHIAGVFLNYGGSKSESATGAQMQKDKSSFYGGGIFFRRYFPVSSRFFLFGESALGVGISKDERRNNDVLRRSVNYTSVNLGLTPGLSFAAGRKVHLEASLNSLFNAFYQTSKQKEYPFNGSVVNTSTLKQFSLGANANAFSNLTIGIRWILPGK